VRADLKLPVHGTDVSPMNQLLLTLRFYATATFQLVAGDTFGLHKSTVCRIVHWVTAAVAALRPKYEIVPTNRHRHRQSSTTSERRSVMSGVYAVSGLPGVIGAIECTHVPIQSPGEDDAKIYRNRKGYFSINVQLVCDQTAQYLTTATYVCCWKAVHRKAIWSVTGGTHAEGICSCQWRTPPRMRRGPTMLHMLQQATA